MMHSQLLTQIRAETRPLHQRLEQVTEGENLMGSAFDLAHYKQLLLSHYWYHLEVARHISACKDSSKQAILDWPECKRIMALAHDLKKLNIDMADLEQNRPAALPIHSWGFAMGLCYVSEGSALGNQQIFKALSKHDSFQNLGVDEFFSCSKSGLSERWKTFLGLLANVSSNEHESTIRGAISGFQYFEKLYLSLHSSKIVA